MFENEEAAKFLDYFVAYRKMMSKVDYIKCMAALNSEIKFSKNQPKTVNNVTSQISESQLALDLPVALDK